MAPQPEAVSPTEQPTTDLSVIEQEIVDSRKNYNHIPNLIGQIQEQNGQPEGVRIAASLCRVFVRLLAQGSLTLKKNLSEKDLVVVRWLKDQYAAFKNVLRDPFSYGRMPPTIRLRMGLLKAEAKHLSTASNPSFGPSSDFNQILLDVVQSDTEAFRDFFTEEYFLKYDDVRFFTFKSVKDIIANTSEKDRLKVFASLISIIEGADNAPQSREDLEDFWCPRPENDSSPVLSEKKHKREAQDAWLAMLNIADIKGQQKRILGVFEASVVPWFTQPERLADFLTNAYNSGGSMSLLALSGIHHLIEKRNLDYPSFYAKLYSLLDSSLLHSKGRSRFFRQLDYFMASTHLTAALVASFIKRLARLSLNAPPGAIVAVVPWIYNQFRRHPACTFMMHREIRDPDLKQEIKDEGFVDPFDPEETDPLKTHAIDSSLWEIVQLQDHYHPNVAAICKIISEPFTRNTYNMEDFLDHTYATLLEAELTKEVKKAPAVEFHIPKRVLLEDGGEEGTLLTRLWGFSG